MSRIRIPLFWKSLAFFAQKYRQDPTFAQSVDFSVLRILSQKYRLYGRLRDCQCAGPKIEFGRQLVNHRPLHWMLRFTQPPWSALGRKT